MKQIKITSHGINISLDETGKIELTIPSGMSHAKMTETYKRIEKDPQYKLLKDFAVKIQKINGVQPVIKHQPSKKLIDDVVFDFLHNLTVDLTFDLHLTDDEKATEELSDKILKLQSKITKLIINQIK